MMGAIHQMERELRAERAAAGRASAQARGRPRTDVVKLRDAKVLYDNSGKTAEEVCKVRWRRQAHLLRLPCSTERSGLSSSHGQLDLFEGLGKNSLVLFDPGDPIPAQRRRVVTDKRFWSRWFQSAHGTRRVDRHHDVCGKARVRHLRFAGRIRTRPDFRANQSRAGVGPCPWTKRRCALQNDGGKGTTGHGRHGAKGNEGGRVVQRTRCYPADALPARRAGWHAT